MHLSNVRVGPCFADDIAFCAGVYDACVNDCQLFPGASTHCSQCGSARFDSHGKAVKVFRYIPIIPQLVQLYASPHSAAPMKWAAEHKYDVAVIRDITESCAFDDFVRKTLFVKDSRHVALLGCTDGVQPFDGSNYDLWPIFLSVLNLPPHLRNQPRHMILCGLVPGPKAPKNINTYLKLLVDELLILDGPGKRVRDASVGDVFTMKGRLCMMVTDYRGQAKVNCQKGSGATQGCMKCEIRGQGAEDSIKKVYLELRRFLPSDHPFRNDAIQFGSVENREAPPMRTHEKIQAFAVAADRASRVFHSKLDSVGDPSRVTAVTGASQFLRIRSWHHVNCSPVELMHLLVCIDILLVLSSFILYLLC